jgi:DNA polymerase V
MVYFKGNGFDRNEKINMRHGNRMKTSEVMVYGFRCGKRSLLPLYLTSIAAGFPSPADDFLDKRIDLNEHLIKHPAATFFVRVQGNSMIKAGIHSGDVLIVDRALEPSDRKIVVAVITGELTVKRLRRRKDKLFLAAENPEYSDIEVTPESDFDIWGVVVHVIHSV